MAGIRLSPGTAQRGGLRGIGPALCLLVILAACSPGSPPPTPEAPPAVASPTPSAPPPATAPPTPAGPIPAYTYRVVRAYPHDPAAFTQGLAFVDGVLYEGTGLVGRSSLRRVDLETGAVVQSRALPRPHFGEGIAVLGDQIVQLTWKSRVGFVYDLETFEPQRTFSYATEGWGLTTDGRRLILSDGTATLHFLDAETLREVSSIQVFDAEGPLIHLNELEYVKGEVWANVWQTDLIVRIDPATGRVTGVVDLAGLLDPAELSSAVDVLNGIAYDAEADRLFVTGKLWPRLFEIEVVPTGE